MQHYDLLQSDLDDMSGQHEISRGGTPNSQLTAATAISFLQEQDDSILSPTIDAQERAIRKIGCQYLALAEQFWTTERAIKIIGEDGYFDAQVFMGGAIRGNRDVRVEAGSSLTMSKSARNAMIMDLMKNGMIDPQIGLRRMEFGGVEKLFEDIQRDIRQAQRENLKLAQGMPLSPNADPNQAPNLELMYGPNTWDNHQLHVAEHNNFRKSQQFEILPDQIKMIFELHISIHEEIINAQMEQQIQQQMALQGGLNQSQNQLALPSGGGNNGNASPPLQ
jgi:hypothetical protein